MPLACQFVGDRAARFVGPAQQTHRITGGALFHDLLQRSGQSWISLLQGFPSSSGSTDTFLGREVPLLEFPDPPEDRPSRYSRKPFHGRNPTSAERKGFPRHVPASLGFIQPSENREEELVGHVHVLDIGQDVLGTLEKRDIYFVTLPKAGQGRARVSYTLPCPDITYHDMTGQAPNVPKLV